MIDFLLGDSWNPEGHLIFLQSKEMIVLSICISIICLALLLRKRIHQKFWIQESLCFIIVLLVVVFVIAEPQWISTSGNRTTGKYVIAIDNSMSMDIRDKKGTRAQQAMEIVEKLKDEIGGDIDIYHFSGEFKNGIPQDFGGNHTDLSMALHRIKDRYLGHNLRGISLITDGIDRGGLRSAYQEGQLATQNIELPGPLTIYALGDPAASFDQSVVSVSSGGFAYQRMNTKIEVEVRGAPHSNVEVALYQGKSIVRTQGIKQMQTVQINEQGQGFTSFEFRPLEVGRFAWEVRIPVHADDIAPSNNQYPIVVKVLREKTRVLQVSGSPSYDQKFLRLFLRQDPSIELISFFILRTHDDFSAGWDDDELSLIAFPYEKLFTTDLDSFDLVIFQNFNYEPYFGWDSEKLLQNITNYVEDGNAFVMTGGNLSFDLGKYANTPIEKILPVRLGLENQMSSDEKFIPALTKEGIHHPITQLMASVDESQKIWGTLPQMDGYNRNLGLQVDSAALLVHPSDKNRRSKMPILAIREIGKGRVMSLGVDASWRWSFSEGVEGESNQAYLRFWKNAIRWLVADPEDRAVSISPSKDNATIGEEIDITVTIRDVGYNTVSGVDVFGKIITPSGTKIPFQEKTDASGQIAIPFSPTEYGMHEIEAECDQKIGRTVFAATSRNPELVDNAPDRGFLQALSENYEGDFHTSYAPPLLNSKAQREIPMTHTLELKQSPLFGILFCIFSGIGWLLRRRGGAR